MSLRLLIQSSVFVLVSATAFAVQVTPACEGWDPNFHRTSNASVPDGPVYASVVFDDGSGSKLYIGGEFTRIGNTLAHHIARWDGQTWSAVGTAWSPYVPTPNNGSSVRALVVYDDGSGPALYAGGSFPIGPLPTPNVAIARWDGVDWTVPGGGISGVVGSLAVNDDGSGPKLYAAGPLTAAGGQPVGNIACWNGSTWSALGTGIPGGAIHTLASYGDGGQRKLYVGGRFTDAGGVSVKHIARWDGTNWSSVSGGITSLPADGSVLSLQVYAEGNESKLIVGGYFAAVDGIAANSVASWNGTTWSAMGTGVTGDVRAMTAWDDGTGIALYAGGFLAAPGGAFGLARWNGTTWTGFGNGVATAAVQTLRAHDDGSGSRLFVGGEFTSVGGGAVTGTFAAWNGTTWSALGTPVAAKGVNGAPVLALTTHDDGTGRALYAAGDLAFGSGPNVSGVGRWNGSTWTPVGTGVSDDYCEALLSYDIGTGSALYAAGAFASASGQGATCIARWDGANWTGLPGLSGGVLHIRALAGFDDGSGPAVFIAGNFQTSIAPQMINIGRWNGTTWSALGGGIDGAGEVHALAVFDDGTGPALYAGGRFITADGSPAMHIARWNGTTWSALGAGLSGGPNGGSVRALCVYDDGSGAALYAGGSFTVAGVVPAPGLARWNGTTWSAVPGALAFSPAVYSLRVVDVGNGPVLSVGGAFAAAGAVVSGSIAQWNGSSWSTIGSGLGGGNVPFSGSPYGNSNSPVVYAQEQFDDGSGGGADLYVGGAFDSAGGYLSGNFARYNTCAETFTNFCAGDGISGSTCPCANYGGANHGCSTSVNPNGGLLVASGLPKRSADTTVLDASELPAAFATIVQGTLQAGGGLGISFGDGLLCVGGAITRVATRFATGGNLQYPGVGDAPLGQAGGVPAFGGSRTYQVWYRDAQMGYCTAATFNLTNGVRFIWTP